MPDKLTMHVISHTHWDREWYRPFQHFRMRLIDLTDALIDILETNPNYKYWHFDGQTIVLEDYLEIRPENESRLRKLIEEGRILIGPWYNQPDEFLVSGEAMIRNLMRGRQMGDDYNNWMKIGYVPDCFGHISQFPQIMRGFGIDNAVFFRGITAGQAKSEFNWEASDGTNVLGINLPDNNAYSNFFYRMRDTLTTDDPIDSAKVMEQVNGLIDDCLNEQPTTDVLLFMDGCDHVFPQPKTPQIIDLANKSQDRGTLKHSTLPDYINDVKSRKPKLETFTGELRYSNKEWKLQALLHGTFSSRMHLKQANNDCQTLMERWVEPFAAIAWTMGREYPASYISHAWKHLLQNHPHDSICGCSVDQVHKDMDYRFDQVKLIGERLMDGTLSFITDQIGSEAETPERTAVLAVYNPLNWERTDVVEAAVEFLGNLPAKGLKITDPDGNEVPFSFRGTEDYGKMDSAPRDVPPGTPIRRWKIAFLAENVPAVGYKAYKVETLDKMNRQPGSLIVSPNIADNGKYRLIILDDGTMHVIDNDTDEVIAAMLGFEDCGDFGDGWNYVKPAKDTVVTSTSSKAKIQVIENSPVRVVFEVSQNMEVPAQMNPNRQERSAAAVVNKIISKVTVARGVGRIDFETTVVNNAKDHRLRVLFSGYTPHAENSYSEQAFDIIERPITVDPCVDWIEPLPTSHPQKTFAGVDDGETGIAILNQGLPEYEVYDDESRTFALTLMRSVIGGVMGPENQIQGEMLGTWTFRYSIYPYQGNWEEAKVWKQGHQFNSPLRTGQTGVHKGTLPIEKSFVQTNTDEFIMTALKKADREDAVVVRGFNAATSPIEASISVEGFKSSVQANLNEEPEAKPTKSPAKATLPAKRIATFMFGK